MSAGSPIMTVYETNQALYFPITIQPETESLTLNSVANTASANTAGVGFPSAKVSGGRRSIGVNARLIRVKFTSTIPDGYKTDGILTLPVLQLATFNAYARGQTGTYTLNGTAYDVRYVGKTPESVI